ERRPRDTARPERRIEHTVGRVARRDELAVPGSEIGRRGPGYQLAVGLLGEPDDYRLQVGPERRLDRAAVAEPRIQRPVRPVAGKQQPPREQVRRTSPPRHDPTPGLDADGA